MEFDTGLESDACMKVELQYILISISIETEKAKK